MLNEPMPVFLGKCLIRRAKIATSNMPAIIVCGTFTPAYKTAKIEDFNERDEMWALEFEVKKSIQFINAQHLQFSPEDFLENLKDIQNPKFWQRK